nr:MAG TPA: Serine Recombinase [Caudoviricetes sp.]
MALMSIGKFAKEIGLSVQHLRKLHNDNILVPDVITKGGTRYYSTEQLLEYLNKDNKPQQLPILLYARVSTRNQKDDLEKQVETLKLYAISKGYNFEIITDIGSGINYNKTGLKELIQKINNKEISKIVILYRDRLVRFGFELIEYLCKLNNIEIEIIDNTTISKEAELTNDLIQIITEIAGKMYGVRSKKTLKLIQEVKSNGSN